MRTASALGVAAAATVANAQDLTQFVLPDVS